MYNTLKTNKRGGVTPLPVFIISPDIMRRGSPQRPSDDAPAITENKRATRRIAEGRL